MKKLFLLCAAVLAMTATAQNTVALADAHWGFEASEATTLVGQYNSTDRYVPAGWTSSNGYQSASTQYKPYIVTNGTNIYASEGTQALHIEGTSMYNLPYVILPAITGVDNYNDLTLVFNVRPGYWSDFGGGEGMWSKCGSSDCRTIKVGHLTEIPDREDFASSVTNVWDTTFNAAGMFDPASANPFCEVRIPMAGFGPYVAIYCEANANCYFCIDEVSIEGGEPAPNPMVNRYSVTLANAHWDFEDNVNIRPSYITSRINKDSAAYIPANWLAGTTNSTAYLPYVHPNKTQEASSADRGYNSRHCLYMNVPRNSSSRVPQYAMLPAITDEAYANLKLEFYARTYNATLDVNTSYECIPNYYLGYITNLNDTLKDNFLNGVTKLANIDLTANYTKYSFDLATIPNGAYMVIYMDESNLEKVRHAYFDDVMFVKKSNSNPDPEPEPTPLTKEALQDSINWWVPSVAHAGTAARATFILHFQNGDVAYGYEWDGTATNAVAAMDEIVVADPDLSAEKMTVANGQYYKSFTYGEQTYTNTWGWGSSKNDAGMFAAHDALTLADGDMIIFSYDDMSVPKLAALTDVVFVEEKEAPATAYTITYNLVGCTGGLNEDDEPNPTTLEIGAMDLDMYFALSEGHTWDNVQISIMMGETEIPDGMIDYYADPNYYAEVGEDNQLNIYIVPLAANFDDDIVVTITCPEAFVFPTEFTPATFEDITVGSNGVYYNPAIQLGNNAWLNGSFQFSTFYDTSYGDYYSDIVVSSNVDANMTANYSNPVSYLYAPTQTPNGSNFAVWNQNYYGIAPVKLDEARTLTGMYVNNTSALINYIKTNAAFNVTFAIQVTGKKASVQTGTITITLADYTDGKTQLVEDWFWQDLSTLGEVDELSFQTLCIDYMAPQYFCFDNLGGTPTTTGCMNVTNAPEASKLLRNGQVLIIRGEHIYNAAGQVVR